MVAMKIKDTIVAFIASIAIVAVFLFYVLVILPIAYLVG
jgi:hypothetical protein